MFDQKLKKQLLNSIHSLSIKYDMFYTNRQYKNDHFKDEQEYFLVQKNLSTEIELEETNVKTILKEYFKMLFPNVRLIAYDSRFICISKLHHTIGKILLIGIENENQRNKIQDEFFNEFSFDAIIEKFEDLDPEIQKKFTF